jgi:hypothetical protein
MMASSLASAALVSLDTSTYTSLISSKRSAGVPRRINLICHRLFLNAGLKERHELVGGDALNVIVELHREGLLTPVARRALGAYVGSIKDIAAG